MNNIVEFKTKETLRQDVYGRIETHYRDNFGKLVGRYTRYTNSKARAEDVVQEAYTRAMECWSGYRRDSEFGAWFNTILNNCMKDNRRVELMHGMTDKVEETSRVIQPSAIPAIIKNQVIKRMEEAPEDRCNVLKLALLEQYQPDEIAKMTRFKANNIRQIVFQFRKQIREEFNWKI